jgi:integrase/recombinase XerD
VDESRNPQSLTASPAWPGELPVALATRDRTAKSPGIDHLGPHDLRCTCAKFCRKAGGDIEQVQELLGHENLATTVTYLGVRQEIHQAVNDRIAL